MENIETDQDFNHINIYNTAEENTAQSNNHVITLHSHHKNGVVIEHLPYNEQASIQNLVIKQEPCHYQLSGEDAEMPDIVAAETVVTTTPPRSRRPCSLDDIVKGSPLCVKIFSPDHKTETVFLDHLQDDASIWSQLTTGKLTSIEESNENDLNVSRESFIALAPDSILTQEPPEASSFFLDANKLQNCLETQHEARRVKKERDRMKKRRQRLNPDFRNKEKEKAKERMRNKRLNPDYREVERKKDRVRRRISRNRSAIIKNKMQENGAIDNNYHKLLQNIEGINVVVKGTIDDSSEHEGLYRKISDASESREIILEGINIHVEPLEIGCSGKLMEL